MRDILFAGRILASVTHEMQNVMAIIKESGALTDDILSLNGLLEKPSLRHGDKLAAALKNIQEQVGRGRNLMIMLNGFAHAAADYPERCDIVRFARLICVLAERMVKLGECSLETELAGKAEMVRGNALMLMQAIFLGIEGMLARCDKGDTLTVSVLPSAAGACGREGESVAPKEKGLPATELEPAARAPEPRSLPLGQDGRAQLRISARNSLMLPDSAGLEALLAENGGACLPWPGGLSLFFVRDDELAPEEGAMAP
ncbi:hypothetical protein LJC59_06010 [Desulfovibrio sp. OttesenSCG-928-A18]|nr:hypothetical protein [Desulfovibrio sp. OttesenSCG-928-A18]